MSDLHVVFVILALIAVAFSDEQGLRWFLGRKRTLSPSLVAKMHLAVSVGIGGLLLTGGLMFLDRYDYLLREPVFLIKMCFVGALVVNGFLIGSISRLATEKAYTELDRSERRRVFFSATVSFTGWVGAVICGLLL